LSLSQHPSVPCSGSFSWAYPLFISLCPVLGSHVIRSFARISGCLTQCPANFNLLVLILSDSFGNLPIGQHCWPYPSMRHSASSKNWNNHSRQIIAYYIHGVLVSSYFWNQSHICYSYWSYIFSSLSTNYWSNWHCQWIPDAIICPSNKNLLARKKFTLGLCV
jgi:hypothetical protein